MTCNLSWSPPDARPTIVITGHGDVAMSVRAMKAGAVTFLEKPFAIKDLVTEIRQALTDDAERRRQRSVSAAFESKMEKLSDEERQVLVFLAQGKTSIAIANEMELSLRTIQFRRASIREKLELAPGDALMEALVKENFRPPMAD
ncbi:MAG: LuxR C-terminal-related transcriptional regulator [Fuerstiella sp.]